MPTSDWPVSFRLMDELFSTEVEQVDGATVIHVRGQIDVATCERLRGRDRGTLTADGGSLILRNPSEAARRLLTAAAAEHLLDEDAEDHPRSS